MKKNKTKRIKIEKKETNLSSNTVWLLSHYKWVYQESIRIYEFTNDDKNKINT